VKHISETVIQNVCQAVLVQVLLNATAALLTLQKEKTEHVLATKDGRFLTVHYGQEFVIHSISVNHVLQERTYVTLALPMLFPFSGGLPCQYNHSRLPNVNVQQTGKVTFVKITLVIAPQNVKFALAFQKLSVWHVMIMPTGQSLVPVSAMHSGRVHSVISIPDPVM
jgi:hypothetical protein